MYQSELISQSASTCLYATQLVTSWFRPTCCSHGVLHTPRKPVNGYARTWPSQRMRLRFSKHSSEAAGHRLLKTNWRTTALFIRCSYQMRAIPRKYRWSSMAKRLVSSVQLARSLIHTVTPTLSQRFTSYLLPTGWYPAISVNRWVSGKPHQPCWYAK